MKGIDLVPQKYQQSKLTKDQYNYLISQASEIRNAVRYSDQVPMPSNVKRAHEIVRRWESKRSWASDRRRKKLDRDWQRTRKEIIFGTAASALTAVERFAKAWGKK